MNKDIGGLLIIGLLLWLIFKGKQPQQASNEETWQWVDWQGNQRSITVHRDVKAN